MTPGTKALQDPTRRGGERPDLLWDPPVKGALPDIILYSFRPATEAGDMQDSKDSTASTDESAQAFGESAVAAADLFLVSPQGSHTS